MNLVQKVDFFKEHIKDEVKPAEVMKLYPESELNIIKTKVGELRPSSLNLQPKKQCLLEPFPYIFTLCVDLGG